VLGADGGATGGGGSAADAAGGSAADAAGGGPAVARRTEVRVVAESGNVAIVGGVPESALTAGDLVVSPRPLDVRDGTPVRVVGE
jgi:hypothetical protein